MAECSAAADGHTIRMRITSVAFTNLGVPGKISKNVVLLSLRPVSQA